MVRLLTVVCLLTVLIWPQPSRATNLLVNGSFDEGIADAQFYFFVGDNGQPPSNTANFIPGWTVFSGSNVDWINLCCVHAQSGSHAIDLVGGFYTRPNTHLPGITQEFATVPGTTYQLSYWVSNNPEVSSPVASVQVTSDGGASLYDGTVTHSGGSYYTGENWVLNLATFVATTTLSDLSFINTVGSSNGGIYLDTVSVEGVSSAVPLPATLPLFASGLAGLGWLSRRKRKQTVHA